MSGKHWLAAYAGRIPAEIDPEAHTSVLAMLEAAMQHYADKPAFRCFGQTLTYADTDRLSRCFAAFLQQKLGVKKGDRIAVMLPNIPAFPRGHARDRAGGRYPGEREPALHAARTEAPAG